MEDEVDNNDLQDIVLAVLTGRRVADPVPAAVRDAAKSALGQRMTAQPDLARLTYDTWRDADVTVRRDNQILRLLVFEVSGIRLRLEVTAAETCRIVGRIEPPTACEVRLNLAGTTLAVPCTEGGEFVAEGVRSGPIRIELDLPSGGGIRRVTTQWVDFRV